MCIMIIIIRLETPKLAALWGAGPRQAAPRIDLRFRIQYMIT